MKLDASPSIILGFRPAWHNDAACRGHSDLFFTVESTRARQLCKECPVRAECLRWALDHDEPRGVWGGLTAAERWKLIRR